MRSKRTSFRVHAVDRVAAACITIGGIGAIVAVSGVFVFLLVVALPLIRPGTATRVGSSAPPSSSPRCIGIDEYRTALWAYTADGNVRMLKLDTGEIVSEERLPAPDSVTAWQQCGDGSVVILGYLDGSVRVARVRVQTDFPSVDTAIADGQSRVVDRALVERSKDGLTRRHRLVVTVGEPVVTTPGEAVAGASYWGNDDDFRIVVLGVEGTLCALRTQVSENLMTGEREMTRSRGTLATGESAAEGVVVTAGAAWLYWPEGRIAAYDLRDVTAPVSLGATTLPSFSGHITCHAALLGGETQLFGDDTGRAMGVFRLRTAEEAVGHFAVAAAHRYGKSDGAITALASSRRTRVFAAGDATGRVRVYQATSEARIIDITVERGAPIRAVAIAPKNDGLVAVTDSGVFHYAIALGHAEVTLASLFTPVWYEGYPRPAHVWQSSGGTDDAEPKLGMWPLVFGTLKATLYSMMLGAPLALMAALYTSEFLSPAVRPRVKTLVESMASLPSVVLGFVAAMVIAPFVQHTLPAILVSFVVLPATLVAGSLLWQLLPQHVAIRFQRARPLAMLVPLSAALWLSSIAGPILERVLFAGDIAAWLDGRAGTPFGGWWFLLLPLVLVAVVLGAQRWTGQRMHEFAARSTRPVVARLEGARLIAIAMAAVVVAAIVAKLLTMLGADPRGVGVVGTYVQRNALVVGFVMGFAIIPIIYTIAEDALSSVPEHIKAASLGAGATHWQTALRVVIPMATSGLFSAVMVGLGRAVGETMIVLMAAGNTPLLDMNIFNGFRTLSANIAVELPEAARGGTHYRTLFLAALILFSMTFAVNTVAETVRMRFRKRTAQV